jgi:type II secretory pathway pseudopilin PulG
MPIAPPKPVPACSAGEVRPAFTLVEMLLVVAMVVLLISILLPSLGSAREMTNRTLCAARLNQLSMASITYSGDHRRRLPTGVRGDGAEHLPWISADLFDILRNYTAVSRPSSDYAQYAYMPDAVLECPNFFLPGPGYYHPGARGWVLGYLYQGGHPAVAAGPLSAGSERWRSPILANDGALTLWTDWNEWSPLDRWTVVPHTARGARTDGSYYNPSGGGSPSVMMGAQGGNVARVDCSVTWKALSDMRQHETSVSTGNWLGMW